MGTRRIYEMAAPENLCVQVVCGLTKEIHEFTIKVADFNKWESGELVQRAFPYLNTDQREMLMTGITPAEWDNLFPDDKERIRESNE